ncbi:TlpA disulfide reductase family protein [Pedobacter sp. BMA]|uniref:TlpA family protein disulfide reductase n=1 Tax=Pedobacter sp. BMA TaxID=1663685 RepID=UPI000649DAA9|nr:TlpA disulfide reductase family protein [Pedobacter sp. BMA]KLT63909.1 hypothetical protein AB669_19460 [Pedobacter sp. BMA]
MRKNILFSAVASLCLNFLLIHQLHAQSLEHNKSVESYHVGDKLPESFWKQQHQFYQNGIATTEKLEAYRGKFLLLDFWASWCSTCLQKWPALDSAQSEFPGQLRTILVNEKRNGDDLSKVKSKLDVFMVAGKPNSLITIYADSLLGEQFPHRLIPHYIWISANGEVLAITGTDFANKQFIQQILQSQTIRTKKQKHTK